MWAQIIKSRMKPGVEDQLRALDSEYRSGDRPGWIRSTILRDQDDPNQTYAVVLFESEEKARESENTPETQQFVERIRALMDGQPEFINCDVLIDRAR